VASRSCMPPSFRRSRHVVSRSSPRASPGWRDAVIRSVTVDAAGGARPQSSTSPELASPQHHPFGHTRRQLACRTGPLTAVWRMVANSGRASARTTSAHGALKGSSLRLGSLLAEQVPAGPHPSSTSISRAVGPPSISMCSLPGSPGFGTATDPMLPAESHSISSFMASQRCGTGRTRLPRPTSWGLAAGIHSDEGPINDHQHTARTSPRSIPAPVFIPPSARGPCERHLP
jgi:hypothetical protein